MNSKEIIKRLMEHNEPPRIGFNFAEISDFTGARVLKPVFRYDPKFAEWGYHPELLEQLNNFPGDVRLNEFGDIYGRLRGETSGECVKGCLEGDWEEKLSNYSFPEFDPEYDNEVLKRDFANSDKFAIGYLPFAIFSRFRDSRRMENALADTLLEPEYVRELMRKEESVLVAAVRKAAELGFDGVEFADDLGTQNALFISPKTFRELFKPVYAAVAGEAHKCGLKFIMHSCGMIYEVIGDLIEAGIDCFQFDQPELYGSDKLAREFGHKAVFYSPVDIQKIMPTGDRKIIEEGALYMVNNFKRICKGGLIVKDYPSWNDLHVEKEWTIWARDVVMANAEI